MTKKQVLVLAFVIALFVLLGTALLWKNDKKIHIYTFEEQNKINSATVSGSVEFIYTEQEQREIIKWKNMSMEDLIEDAINGDRAALGNLGEYFLLGLDFPIDVQKANVFFAKSASLGFAPALDQISKMYLHDESNLFLAMFYKNLTIAFGHTEFTQSYHDVRDKILKNFGKGAVTEIERLASHKMLTILENQQGLKKAVNKKEFSGSMKKITDEDSQYSYDYWLKIYKNNKGENPLQQVPWYLRIDSLELNEDYREFLTLTAEGFLKIPELLSSRISDFDIQKYLENNIPELLGTRAGQEKICKDLRQLYLVPLIRKEALDAIMNENNGSFETASFDLEKEVNKRTASQINKIINEFKSSIKY